MRHSALTITMFVPALSLAACSGLDTEAPEAIGTATAAIELAPGNAQCAQIVTTQGTTTVTNRTTLAPEASTVFALNNLQLGADTFTATAFGLPCAQVVATTPATWSSAPVTATVTSGLPVALTFVMTPVTTTGPATVGLNFQPSTHGVITEFSVPPGGTSTTPATITAGPDGALWFTYEGPLGVSVTSVGRITTAGAVSLLAIPGQAGPGNSSITTGPDGNLWFTLSGLIDRLTTADAFRTFPVSGAGQLNSITTGPDGNMWFTDGSANRIGHLSLGGVAGEITVPTAASVPAAIATGADGALWFTEFTGNKIGRVTVTGTFTEVPLATAGSEPDGITAGPDGNLWFAEFGGSRIGRITTAGAVTEFPTPTANANPIFIVAGPDGNLWFTEQQVNQVGRITPAGVITEFPVPTANSAPRGIASGSDGNVWFVESTTSKIGQITP